jgi:hypothetical protein
MATTKTYYGTKSETDDSEVEFDVTLHDLAVVIKATDQAGNSWTIQMDQDDLRDLFF